MARTSSIWSWILLLEFIAVAVLYYSKGEPRRKPSERSTIGQPTQKTKVKLFVYYVLTESCLPPQLAAASALGNLSRCDVFILSFKSRCEADVLPNMRYYYHPDTTWTTGRNLIYKYGLNSGKDYLYHTFIDDDIQLFYTKQLAEYAAASGIDQFDRKKEFMDSFISSKDGLSKAVVMWDKSPWRELEDTLLLRRPAFAQVNLCEDNGNQIRRFQMDKWQIVCPHEMEMPDITPVFFIDTLLISYHKEAASLLLPYSAILDETSWFVSAMYQMFRAKALLYRHGIAVWSLSVVNSMHRSYPRGTPPKDYLEKYFDSDGADIKSLLDPRETDFVVFFDNGKWKNVFFADRGVCSSPIRFPVEYHYHVL